MKPATRPRAKAEDKLLVVDAASGSLTDRRFEDLPELLSPGDLLVVNDAAALPASVGFSWKGKRAELRILRGLLPDAADAIVLGEGDRTVRTEDRGPPPKLEPGAHLELDGGLQAVVDAVDPASPRLVKIRFGGSRERALVQLYRGARPIQYAYVATELALWDVQTVYAGRPWASEMPSAGRPLSWATLGRLRARGVEIARITHGAGLSSTGDPALDARLPLPEAYDIDRQAAAAINRATAEGRRIVAVGTSVVRALESSARRTGFVEPGSATTDLVIGASSTLVVVNSILTGMHEVGTSHFALLEAFAATALLTRAVEHGDEHGYLLHEFGDSMIVVGRRQDRRNVA